MSVPLHSIIIANENYDRNYDKKINLKEKKNIEK